MKLKSSYSTLLYSLALTLATALSTFGAVKPKDTASAPALPPIWQAASTQERLKALRVAELDATRLLTERVFGVQLDAETTIRDFALETDEVRTSLSQTISGVANAEDPEYLPDGRVQVVRAVKLSTVVETLRQVFQKKSGASEAKLEKIMETRKLAFKSELIDTVGVAALPGSDGMKKILAKRAAEVDAYRRLAERALGVQISSESTVRDFALKSDTIKAALVQVVKGAEPVSIDFLPDSTCKVKLSLKIGPLVKVIERVTKVAGKTLDSNEKTLQKELQEVGHGVAPSSDTGIDRPSILEVDEQLVRIIEQTVDGKN